MKKQFLIVKNLLKNLRSQSKGGFIEVRYLIIGKMSLFGGITNAIKCAALKDEYSHQGIYYDSSDDQYFYYGTPQGLFEFDEELEFTLTENLLDLLSQEVRDTMKEVRKTKLPKLAKL